MFRQRIALEEVLQHLRGQSMVPSGLGAQLDKLRDGVSGGTVNPEEVRERLEKRMLEDGALLRCLSGLAKAMRFRTPDLTTLPATARRAKVSEGALALVVLRAYQPWGTQSEERALAEVYLCKRRLLDEDVSETRADALAQLFREGRFSDLRAEATRLYKEAFQATQLWVHAWPNRTDQVAVG